MQIKQGIKVLHGRLSTAIAIGASSYFGTTLGQRAMYWASCIIISIREAGAQAGPYLSRFSPAGREAKKAPRAC